MRINKNLIPLKLHFFLFSGGMAPVASFMPVYAKQLGFTSVSFGWSQTIYPILVTLLKPLAGGIIDNMKNQKFILMMLLMTCCLSGFSLQWIEPLPTSNTVQIKCNDSLLVTVCSEFLKENFYIDKLKYSLKYPVYCKAFSKNYILRDALASNESSTTGAFFNNGDGIYFPSESFDLNIELQGVSKIEDGCASLLAHSFNTSNDSWDPPLCQRWPQSLELQCKDEVIQVLTRKTAIGDYEILSTPQFWCLSLLMVVSVLAFSLANSISDVITFGLLGNKPENYGIQKFWSSLGWGVTGMASGIIIDKLSSGKADKDFTSSFYALLIIMTLDALVASRIRITIPEKSISIKQDMKALFRKPKVITFAFWCFANGFLFSFVWNFVLWYAEDLAAAGGSESKAWMKTLDGLVLISQCIAGEVPFIIFAGYIMKKIGRTNCMTLVLFGFGLRFLLYSVLSNPWWILPIEVLQGITYGLMYATMTTYASAISPPGAETTVQNIFSSLFEGPGTATGGFVGGYLVRGLGLAKTFFILGIGSIVLGFLHMITQKFLDASEKIKPDEAGEIDFSKEDNSLNIENEALNKHSSDYRRVS